MSKHPALSWKDKAKSTPPLALVLPLEPPEEEEEDGSAPVAPPLLTLGSCPTTAAAGPVVVVEAEEDEGDCGRALPLLLLLPAVALLALAFP